MAHDQRIKLDPPVPTRFVAGNAKGSGRIQDVSPGGFFVQTPVLLRDGDPIELTLEPESGERIIVQGIVRWNTAALRRRRTGFGVHVLRSSECYRGFLNHVLAKAG